MKKKLFFLLINLFVVTLMYTETSLKKDKHFIQLVKTYNIQDIIEIEDFGDFFYDPLVKIVLDNNYTFCIKHSFSRNREKLKLYSIDDYELGLVIEENGKIKKSINGIPFNYLQMYFDFDLNQIEDIIIHYDEIKKLVEHINRDILYFKTTLSDGMYIKYSCPDDEYSGRLTYKKQLLIFKVFDINKDRIKFEN